MKRDNTSLLNWIYSRNIKVHFRKSVIISHYISILKEENNMVISIDGENTFDEIQNTYL